MENVYIRKEDLNRWIAKYFFKDLISIDYLLDTIEELDGEVQALKEQIEYLTQKKDDEDVDSYVDEIIMNEKGV